MKIRDARAEDATAACDVLRRSIIELCVADHHNDPAVLDRWLANKTPAIVGSWITRPDNSVLLAVEGDTILGVGAVSDAGDVTLNYVSPDARFRGVSRTLLAAMEARAQARGATCCMLVSTEAARLLYQSAGYADTGAPAGKFGTTSSYPMAKSLD